MRTPILTVLAATVLLTLCLSSAAARGSESLTLHTRFAPDRLGVSTTVYFSFEIQATSDRPSPATSLDLYLPGGVGLATSSLGLERCEQAVLSEQGPGGCPPNSLVGYGTALGLVPAVPYDVDEQATVTALLAGSGGGQLELLFYTEASTPVSAQLVLPSRLETEGGRFGGRLDTAIPLIPTWPGGPDVSLVQFTSSFGPAGLTYYLHRGGKTIRYHPRGVTVPTTCPRGGFGFTADVTFADGATATAASKVACPPKASSGKV
jgi:hypothetical protein